MVKLTIIVDPVIIYTLTGWRGSKPRQRWSHIGIVYPDGGSVDTRFFESRPDIGTCDRQWELCRYLALLCGTVHRCDPRCTSLYRCFEGQGSGVIDSAGGVSNPACRENHISLVSLKVLS